MNISKGGFSFPSALYLADNLISFEADFLSKLNNTEQIDSRTLLATLADIHAELLYLHPFREGNGRIIRLFTWLISVAKRGEDIDFSQFAEPNMLSAYIHAVQSAATQDYAPMRTLFDRLNS